jgi:hypothetical protein
VGRDVLAQIGDDVALHGLDGLGDAGEVGGELAGEVEDVLRLFEELFLVCGFDGATTLESRDLGVEVVSLPCGAWRGGRRGCRRRRG